MKISRNRSCETALRAAMMRLLEGNPQYCDGRLTISNLAREAEVSRATANRATTILAEYRRAVDQRRVSQRDNDSEHAPSENASNVANVRAQHIQIRALLDEATANHRVCNSTEKRGDEIG